MSENRNMNLVQKCALLFLQCFVGFLASFVDYLTSKPKSVENFVIVITGAAQGINREVAFMFSSLGAKVVILDKKQDLANHTAKLINSTGGQAYAFGCDVSNAEEVREVAKRIYEDPALGCPDIVLCGAGVWTVRLLEDTSDDDVKKTFNVNTLGCFWTVRAFYPYMLKLGRGHIVSVSSMAGHFGNSYSAAYSASKFAVRGLMESLECEISDRGLGDRIKLTTIYPFLTETDLLNSCQITTDVLSIQPVNKTADSIVQAILYEKSEAYIPYYTMYICVWLKCLMQPSHYVRSAVRNFLNIRYR